MNHLLQIDWTNLQYTADEVTRDVYSFPVQIRILIGVTFLFLLIIIILLMVILGSRIYKTQRENKRNFLRKKYQQVFTHLLFEDDILINDEEVLRHFELADLKIQFHR